MRKNGKTVLLHEVVQFRNCIYFSNTFHRDDTKKENNKAVFDGVGWNCNLGIVHTIPTIRSS